MRIFPDEKHRKAGPKPRLRANLSTHSAWIRGRLVSSGLLSGHEVPNILARCSPRAEAAFALGALAQPEDPLLSAGEVEYRADNLLRGYADPTEEPSIPESEGPPPVDLFENAARTRTDPGPGLPTREDAAQSQEYEDP